MSINAALEPLVSVIIPTYNRPLYLRAALESVVQQTYQNIEVIVSDDSSLNSPQDIVESFQDSRIRLRRNHTNLGIALNVTNAFQEARGKYIACLNDDDMWEREFLAKLVPQLEANPNLVLAFCDHYLIDADNAIDYPATESNTQYWQRHKLARGVYQPFYDLALVHKAVFAASAAVIRTDAVEWDKVRESGNSWDYYICYLACCSGGGAYYCPERLARYRVHAQSITGARGRDVRAKIRKAKVEIFCYERFIEDERLQEFRPHFIKRLAYMNTNMGVGLLRDRQIAAARPYLLRALGQQKLNMRALLILLLSFIPQPLISLCTSTYVKLKDIIKSVQVKKKALITVKNKALITPDASSFQLPPTSNVT